MTNIVKQCEYQNHPLLMYLVNNSFSEGYVPNDLKIAKVIPLFKSGERHIVSNRRLKASLPVILTVFEKAAYYKFLFLINSNNILHNS